MERADNLRAFGPRSRKRYRSLVRRYAEHDLPERALRQSLRKDDDLAVALNFTYPLALLVIQRGLGCVALSFAQRNLLVLLSLFFLAACACCPLSFSPVSTVIWPNQYTHERRFDRCLVNIGE